MKTYVTGFVLMTVAVLIYLSSSTPAPVVVAATAFVAGMYFGLILGHKSDDKGTTGTGPQ